MALTIGELVALISADNRGFRRGMNESRRDMQQFQRDANGRLHDMQGRFVREGEASGRGWGMSLGRAAGTALAAGIGGTIKTATTAGRALLSAALPMAVVASTAAAAAPLLAPVGAELLAIGKACLSAAPALLALGVAGKVTALAFGEIFKEGSAARKALEPLKSLFEETGKAGSLAAAKGVRPLADSFKKAAFPAVKAFMVDLGKAANTVTTGFLKWAKSGEGIKSLKDILGPIGKSLNNLAPRVKTVAVEFVAMLGRIMGVSTAAGESGLARVLDTVAEKLKGITADSVQGGLDKLKQTFTTVKNVAGTLADWIGTLVDAYRMYTTEFRAVADVLSILAIAFGGPVVAAAGAAGLIIRHFDQVKAAWERLKAAFTGGGSGPLGGFIANLRTAGREVLPSLVGAFGKIKAAVLPVLQEIWTKIKTQLVPAFGEFVAAVSPVVSWLVDKLGPVVANTFKNLLGIVSGAISIITGIFKVFTAVLKGDWGKAWDGIKQILSGAWKIIQSVVKQAINVVKGAISIGLGVIKAVWGRVWDSMKSLVKVAWNGIKSAVSGAIGAVKGAVSRGVGAVKSAWSSAWNAVKSAASRAMSGLKSAVSSGIGRVVAFHKALPGKILSALGSLGGLLVSAGKSIIQGLLDGISSMLGKLRGLLDKVTGWIPDWKGPASRDKKLLYRTGQLIMRGLIDGMGSTVDQIKEKAQKITDLIRKAFEGKKTDLDDQLLAALKRSTARLTALARRREKILERLAEARQFAADVTSNARSFAGLTSLSFTDAEGNATAPTGKGILGGLQGKLAQIKAFAADIKTLAKKGLGKGLLRQLLEAGPEAGGPLAAALAAADSATFGSIQAAQREIDAISDSLGKSGADILYDSGKGAAGGFLAGLKEQEKAIQRQMDRIADNFARRLADALGLKFTPRLTDPITPVAGQGGRAALHIENYHEAARGSVRGTAEELLLLTTARG